MKRRKWIAAALSAALVAGLAACGNGAPVNQSTEETETPAISEPEKTEPTETSLADASAYVGGVDNANIDAAVYLDYSAGIAAGVYRWILSDDGDYYALAAVDEDGEPLTAEESAINVGANNAERGDGGGMPGGADAGTMPDGGNAGTMPDGGNAGTMPDSGNAGAMPDSGNAGAMPEGGNGGGMRGGMGFGGFGGGGTVYQGVYMNANVTNLSNQTMLVYVPAAYLTTDADGNVTGVNHEGAAGNYTADTAPIVYLNECGGWKSSSPRSCDASYIEQGMVYVTAGARSRDAVGDDGTLTGKAPTQMADLKSGVIALRANRDVIPGDTDRIISVGTSGGGQMSSIFGASGNMPEYYPYLYETGALGVTKNDDGTYSSAFPDNIYAAQCYCPIADIENADIAYAWWWVDLADAGGTYGDSFTAFDRRLQELEADAFVEYLNGLNLKDADGNALTLTDLRSGTYYDAILQNVSDALNAAVTAGDIDPATAYPDSAAWLTDNGDGTWSVTDMAGFMIGTGLVNQRNKAIPGFDALDKSAENNAFGTPTDAAVHFSRSVAEILQTNYDELSALDGFNAEQVDAYISEALTGDGADAISRQADLLNATEIMLGNNGLTPVNPALYWRDRSGTADQHTSFSVGYNICLAARSLGLDADYHLVWDMPHGSSEGTSTGTFIDWIHEICA